MCIISHSSSQQMGWTVEWVNVILLYVFAHTIFTIGKQCNIGETKTSSRNLGII